ncbi:MAG TPA: sulfur oxidation c-type cytochrome SoxA [Burkholderiales bacterium]|nr:sulfur oxidation c-type cytochrome SoxA [Burkholderiales bacterium]
MNAGLLVNRTVLTLSMLAASWMVQADTAPAEERESMIEFFKGKFPGRALDEYVNGALMLSPDSKAQYDSIMEFPPFQGDLDKGRMMWEKPFANGGKFSDCFADGGRNVAGNFPYFEAASGKIVTFEMKINRCLRENGEREFDYGDRNTMGILTAYARTLSDGMRVNVKVDGPAAQRHYRAGRDLFFRRIGQLNLACASCHVANAGNYFRDEIISPTVGHTTHFPVFRGGDNLYTLHMRYQRCMEAMRAVPFPAGSQEFNDLEYFHSYLSNGLPMRSSIYRK